MESLLTVEQYASRAQLHPDSVRRQLREGRLRAIKKGRVWRIPESAMMEDSPAKRPEPKKGWTEAAMELAPIYTASIEGGGELTASSQALGDLYPYPHVPEAETA